MDIQNISTGWVYSYVWDNKDYASWAAYLGFQLFYCLYLTFEIPSKFKQTLIWFTIVFAVAVNIGAAVSAFFFLDCLMFNTNPDPATCGSQLHACYFFEAIAFLLSYILLFYRKYVLIPSQIFNRTGLLDSLVLLLCIALSLTLNVSCIYGDIDTCFNQDIYQASASVLSFVYFEIWFLYSVSIQSLQQQTTSSRRISGKQKLEIFQLSLLTGTMAFIYLVGSISYHTWGGNFYTNAMWNMGWCILPLLCIQTVISRRFLDIFKNTGLVTNTKTVNGRDQERESVTTKPLTRVSTVSSRMSISKISSSAGVSSLSRARERSSIVRQTEFPKLPGAPS
ncbi:hypothetical protein BDR26DRAFT_872382 [Obelidium mucronatum]|nr:hypothetical protein BDR26DRAFT_872382 [Obelidium mucronatum]